MTKLASPPKLPAFWTTLPHRFWQWLIPHPAYGRIVAALGLLVMLGLTTVHDYGVSWDEGTEVAMVKYNVEWLTQREPIPRDLKHYGLVFNGSSELFYQAKQWLAQPQTYSPRAELALNEGDRGVAQALHRRLQLKHILTFLWTLMAYSGVIMIVALLAGAQNAWFAAVVLALIPRFWAHGFFNPKDIPFASLFTLVTACGAFLIQYDHHCTLRSQSHRESSHKSPQFRWRWAVGFGVLMGLLTGVRIGGWVVLVFFGLAHLLTGGVRFWQHPRRWVGHFVRFYGSIFLGWAITTIAVYPSAWQNPIVWFWETNRYLSSHPWASDVLFQGTYWSASELPWYYIPQWLGMTVPLIWLLAAVLGLVLWACQYAQFTVGQRAAVVLVVCQGLGLPLAAIATNASVYGGLRQFLFVLPAIAVLAAYTLIWTYQKLRQWWRLVMVSALVVCLSAIVVDMSQLHPHQYAYFNRASGGIAAAAGQYDVDYWGLSLREGVEWLNAVADETPTLAIGGPQYVGEIFARSDMTVLDLEKTLGYGTIAQPDYYVSMSYLELPDLFPHCPVVHEVECQGVPLSIVKDCTGVAFEPAEPISQTASGG